MTKKKEQAAATPLDAHAVALRLGVSVFTVKREARRGALDFYRIGAGKGRLRFSEEHVQTYLDRRENKQPSSAA